MNHEGLQMKAKSKSTHHGESKQSKQFNLKGAMVAVVALIVVLGMFAYIYIPRQKISGQDTQSHPQVVAPEGSVSEGGTGTE